MEGHILISIIFCIGSVNSISLKNISNPSLPTNSMDATGAKVKTSDTSADGGVLGVLNSRKNISKSSLRNSFRSSPAVQVNTSEFTGEKQTLNKESGDEEVVQIESKLESNGHIKMKFSSHGKRHVIDLIESRTRLSDLPLKLTGSSEKFTQQVQDDLKNIKMMRGVGNGASIVFKMEDGNPTPIVQKGVFKRGKHQFHLASDVSSNKTRVTRSSVEDHIDKHLMVEMVAKDKRRQKRDIPYYVSSTSAKVELVIIADYAIWSQRSSGNVVAAGQTSSFIDVILYFAHMVDIMDSYFNTMKNSDVRVDVELAGFVLIENSWDLSNLIENHEYSGRIAASSTLQRFTDWLETDESDSYIPPYDHVMLFTGYDMYDEGTGSTNAISTVIHGKICQFPNSNSFIESTDLLTMDARVASNVLGKSLGADTDGSSGSSGCTDEGFIMGQPSSDHIDNGYLFSCCSQRSFYATIKASGSCLLTSSASRNYHSSIDEFVDENLPGETFTADDQCYLKFGTSACGTNLDICRELSCVSPDDLGYCTYYHSLGAADGTTCGVFGTGRCFQGACIYTGNGNPNADQGCYVGECYSGEKKCDYGVNTELSQMFRCYHESKECDGTKDCSDGSDEESCYCPYGYSKCITGARKSYFPSDVSKICVPDTDLCDKYQDCEDGSDEGIHYCDVTTAAKTWWNGGDASTTGSSKGECYVCDDSNQCVSTEDECDSYCPLDYNCKERLKWLDNAATGLPGPAVAHILSVFIATAFA